MARLGSICCSPICRPTQRFAWRRSKDTPSTAFTTAGRASEQFVAADIKMNFEILNRQQRRPGWRIGFRLGKMACLCPSFGNIRSTGCLAAQVSKYEIAPVAERSRKADSADWAVDRRWFVSGRRRSRPGAASSAAVLRGCCGSLNRFRTGPRRRYSRHITITRVGARAAMTPRSWVMGEGMPTSRWSFGEEIEDLRLTVTSSAVVGSSAIQQFGPAQQRHGDHHRWRMPPENSWGNMWTAARGFGICTRSSISTRPWSPGRRPRWRDQHLRHLPSDGKGRD